MSSVLRFAGFARRTERAREASPARAGYGRAVGEVIVRGGRRGGVSEQPDHSMKDEEPLGSDQAPTDIHDNRQQRHPGREGKGGVE